MPTAPLTEIFLRQIWLSSIQTGFLEMVGRKELPEVGRRVRPGSNVSGAVG